MICSHYEVEAWDKNGDIIEKTWVYSFEEAYYWIDNKREEYYLTAVKFVIRYPDKDVYGEERKGNGANRH